MGVGGTWVLSSSVRGSKAQRGAGRGGGGGGKCPSRWGGMEGVGTALCLLKAAGEGLVDLGPSCPPLPSAEWGEIGLFWSCPGRAGKGTAAGVSVSPAP